MARAVALAMAALLVLGEIGPKRSRPPGLAGRHRCRADRGATCDPAGRERRRWTSPPEGDGPWTLIVLATGSPRDGHQTATLGSPEGTLPAFTVAATLPRYPVVIPGDQIRLEGTIRPRPESSYGEYLARIGAAGTLTARSIEIVPVPADPGRHLEGCVVARPKRSPACCPNPKPAWRPAS